MLAYLMLTLCSCGGDLPPLSDGGHTTPLSRNQSLGSTMDSSGTTTSIEQGTRRGDGFKLSTTKTSNINPYQQFLYNSDNVTHTMEISFSNEGVITASIVENSFKWQNKFTIQGNSDGTWLIDGMLYELNTKDMYGEEVKITIKLNETDDVKWVHIKDRTYTKIATSSSVQIKSRLKYMEDNSVEVQKGQTLRVLIELYNKENANRIGKTYTRQEICNHNNLGAKCTVRVGQVIEFPK